MKIHCPCCGTQHEIALVYHGAGGVSCPCGVDLTVVETDDQTGEWSVTVSRREAAEEDVPEPEPERGEDEPE
jgi:uncharacterized Zn finger protein (UPF0148 family)